MPRALRTEPPEGGKPGPVPCGLTGILPATPQGDPGAGAGLGFSLSPCRADAGPCVIYRCAAARVIADCRRECADFPCTLYRHEPHDCQNLAGSYPWRANDSHEGRPAPDATLLRVHLLGRFRVFVAGQELQDRDWSQGRGPTAKVKALLAILVVRGAQGARRETLTELLWPRQRDLGRAITNLHVALHCLRCTLEPGRVKGARSGFVDFDGLRYRLTADGGCWTDADAFERHCSAASAAARRGDQQAAFEQWTLAASLYSGDYFTDLGTAYSEEGLHDWCLPRREALRADYLTVLLRLADHHAEHGDPEAGLRLARHALRLDPECEAAIHLAEHCRVVAA